MNPVMTPQVARTEIRRAKDGRAWPGTSPVIRVLARCVEVGECWEWRGSTNIHGYGQVSFRGGPRMAHRVTYTLLRGEIPEGLTLDHLCRNTLCVNPDHLEPVTMRENVLRGFGPTATNARQTVCKNGHRFTPENTYTSPKGYRTCRTCAVAYRRAYRRPRKSA